MSSKRRHAKRDSHRDRRYDRHGHRDKCHERRNEHCAKKCEKENVFESHKTFPMKCDDILFQNRKTYGHGCKKGEVHDIIIVGTGPAGSALAYRLLENTNLSVLMIEAGRDDMRDPRSNNG